MGSLSGKSMLAVNLAYSKTSGLITAPASLALSHLTTWTAGSGANQGDILYTGTASLVATHVDLDFGTGGGLTDIFGTAIDLAKIKELVVVNKTLTTSYDLLLSGTMMLVGILKSWVDDALTHPVEPGGVYHMQSPIDGIAIAAASDVLRIDAGANTVEYEIALVGVNN